MKCERRFHALFAVWGRPGAAFALPLVLALALLVALPACTSVNSAPTLAPTISLPFTAPTAPATEVAPATIVAPAPAPSPTAEAPAGGEAVTADPTPAAGSADSFTGGLLSVDITSPEDGAEVQTSPVEIRGTAAPETVITFGDEIVLVDASGTFSVTLALEEGPNIIEITASDPDGNQATDYLTLYYEP